MFKKIEIAWLRQMYRLRSIEAINAALLRRTTRIDPILRAFGAEIAARPGVHHGPVIIHNAEPDYRNLHLGENTHLGRLVFLDLSEELRLEAEATVSMGCTLLTHISVGDRSIRDRVPDIAAPLTIGAGSYIGANVTVLPGCDIGALAIVGAGAVVTRPVEAETTVVGVPARPIRVGCGTRN